MNCGGIGAMQIHTGAVAAGLVERTRLATFTFLGRDSPNHQSDHVLNLAYN